MCLEISDREVETMLAHQNQSVDQLSGKAAADQHTGDVAE
jgi:hypothetical protein